MKKLLLIALVASGLAFVPMHRSDAGVWVGVGPVGVGSGSAAMAIPITDTAIIRTDTIDPTTVIILGHHTTGITGIEFITTTTIIIITSTIKLLIV